MTDPIPTDRRLSFRIEENALLEWRQVPQQLPIDALEALFPPSPHFSLLSELQQLDLQLQEQLYKLTENQAQLAGALQLLNRKVDRLAAHCRDPDSNQEPQPITLSEGGLSLHSSEPLSAGQWLALRLRLLPDGGALLCLGQTVYCRHQADRDYRIGVRFEALDSPARDRIARHILARQASDRRHQLQQQGPDA